MKILIPPNGFAGQVQQTQANQLVRTRGMTNGTRRRKRKSSSSSSRPKRRASSARPKRRASSAKPKRLVKGSAAAKRYMAKLRRMRRK